jgi:hypothetical protein
MDKNTENTIIKIAGALGSGGRSFSAEDVQAVEMFIFSAKVRMNLAQAILDGKFHVAVDKKGEVLFSDSPDKFRSKK